MRLYPVSTPWWLRSLHPDCLWEMPAGAGDVYLTFDDGPDPDVTPFVLDTLKEAGAKATFFCIGRNVEAHPAVYRRILDEGHAVGNHTHAHLDGWRTRSEEYTADVAQASSHIRSRLFRPPYGRIRRTQSRTLRGPSFDMRIVMWSLLSGDFDVGLSEEDCLRNVLKHMAPGSIVTFHDSRKAEPRLRHALPKVLERMGGRGWKGRAIESEIYAPTGTVL